MDGYQFYLSNVHRCKTNGVAQITSISTLASWFMLEYIVFVETHAIISWCSLDAYYDLGFRHNVLPLYYAVSLIKGWWQPHRPFLKKKFQTNERILLVAQVIK